MAEPIELYHPVTEENAREFVNATAPSDTSDEDKEQRTQQLLQTAAENNSWRESRDPVERMQLQAVPFASHPQEDAQPDTTDETTPDNPDAPAPNPEDPAPENQTGGDTNEGA